MEYEWNTKTCESALGFAQVGLDRVLPYWKPFGIDFERCDAILNLGAGNKVVLGTQALDWPDWNGETDAIPMQDASVDGIIATHFMEHLADPGNVLHEAARVLKDGCPFNILVPHGQSLMYAQDPDHKTQYVIRSWKTILDNPYYNKGNNSFPFEIGANFLFGMKEENLALVTQLIRLPRG